MGSYWSSPPPAPAPEETPAAPPPVVLEARDGQIFVIRARMIRKRARGELLCPVCLQVPAEEGASTHPLLEAAAAIQIPVCKDCRWQLPDAPPADRCECCTTRPAVGTLERNDWPRHVPLCGRCLDSGWVTLLLTTLKLGIGATRPPSRKRKAAATPTDTKKLAAQCADCSGQAAAQCNHAECTAALCSACLHRRHGTMGMFYEHSTVWRCAKHAS